MSAGGRGLQHREAAVADAGRSSMNETKEKEGKQKSKHMDGRSHAGSVRETGYICAAKRMKPRLCL